MQFVMFQLVPDNHHDDCDCDCIDGIYADDDGDSDSGDSGGDDDGDAIFHDSARS